MTLLHSSVLACVLCLGPAPAIAEDAVSKTDDSHMAAVTIAPIMLAIGLFEFTGEYKIADKMGVGVIVGVGSIETETIVNGEKDRTSQSLYELGAQFRYYLLGDFNHGLQVGVEFAHVGASAAETDAVTEDGETVKVAAKVDVAGTGVGGFIGYKIAADFGLTFELQAGVQQFSLDAEGEGTASNDSGTTVTVEAKESGTAILPLVNIQLGWSF